MKISFLPLQLSIPNFTATSKQNKRISALIIRLKYWPSSGSHWEGKKGQSIALAGHNGLQLLLFESLGRKKNCRGPLTLLTRVL